MGLIKNNQKIPCDVLVIGGGGAGLRSAIEARKNGASVIVVSKDHHPGPSGPDNF
jgi:succinate dehydrogenase/fumarate reductase flavoprotein subunit